jgi:hypothetical protein
MAFSIWVLAVAVLLVGALFIGGVAIAARRQRAPVMPWTSLAAVLFLLVAALNWGLAASGVLGRFDRVPPPAALFFVFDLGLAFFIAYSRLGELLVRGLSYSALVGYQAFRILAELLLFAALHEGLAPIALTVEGYNYDIVTGVTALALGLHLRRKPNLPLVRAWNWMGIAFLVVIAFIALGSMPTPLRVFMSEPSNLWVTTVPYVLLPGILVVAALTGHLLVFRKLAREK